MDSLTLKLLELFSSRKSLSLSDLSAILNVNALTISDSIAFMLEKNYLRTGSDADFLYGEGLTLDKPLLITPAGWAALEEEKTNRKKYKYNEIRSWVTLAIAIAAFIKSFFF